jgi:tRNA(fMet)-specific endonuclease VapC
MIRYILDTDILTLLQERHPLVLKRVAECPPSDLAITVISVEEQLTGWYSRLRRVKRPDQLAQTYLKLTTTVTSLSRLPILTYDEPAILRAEALRKQRLNIGKMDLRIAAIALERGAVVVTRNSADFGRVPELTIDDWSK